MKLEDFTYMVDDDFLPEGMSEHVRKTLLDGDADWKLGKSLLGRYKFKTNIDPYEGPQFNHLFFINSRIYSPYWEDALSILAEFCDKHNIEVHAMIRCKSNLTFPDTAIDDEPTETPHVDHAYPHFVFLYYVNDADGDTILYNEQFDDTKEVVITKLAEVSPKQGRGLLFNGSLYHSPSVPKNGYRAVINMTFIGEFK